MTETSTRGLHDCLAPYGSFAFLLRHLRIMASPQVGSDLRQNVFSRELIFVRIHLFAEVAGKSPTALNLIQGTYSLNSPVSIHSFFSSDHQSVASPLTT